MDIEELLYKCAPSNTRSLAGTNQHMGYLFSLLSNPDAEERSGEPGLAVPMMLLLDLDVAAVLRH